MEKYDPFVECLETSTHDTAASSFSASELITGRSFLLRRAHMTHVVPTLRLTILTFGLMLGRLPDAQSDVFDFIVGFYHRVRRHSHLDQLSPLAFEQLQTGS